MYAHRETLASMAGPVARACCLALIALEVTLWVQETTAEVELQQIQSSGDSSPSAAGQSIFCSTSNNLPGQGAVGAARAICNIVGSDYYSGSASDAFMASRFTGMNNSACVANATSGLLCSTESNTPWMLADYMVNLDLQQGKAAEEKRIMGEAQIDLLLCNNPNCDVIGDVVAVANDTTNAEGSPGILTLGFSTVLNTLLVTPEGAAKNFNGITARKANFNSVGRSTAGTNTEKPQVHQMVYRMEGQPIVWSSWQEKLRRQEEPRRQPYPGIPNTMSLSMFVALLGKHTSEWENLQFGVYKAREIVPSLRDLPSWASLHHTHPEGGCVIIIWPRMAWMEQHGWNKLDAECMGQQLDGMPLYVFDGYFYQAQFLGNRSFTRRLLYVGGEPIGQGHLHVVNGSLDATGAVDIKVNGSTLVKEVQMMVPFSEPIRNANMSTENDTFGPGGDLGVSWWCNNSALYMNKLSGIICDPENGVLTQDAAGCISTCTDERNRTCGGCSILQVGTATVAAWPVPKQRQVGQTSGTIQSRLLGLHFMSKWAQAQDNNPLEDNTTLGLHMTKFAPWCAPLYNLSLNDSHYLMRHAFISNLDFGNTLQIWLHPSTPDTESFAGSLSMELPAAVYYDDSVVYACDYWDRVGVGFADKEWVDKSKIATRAGLEAGSGTIADLLRPQFLEIKDPPGHYFKGFEDGRGEEAWWDLYLLRGSLDQVVQAVVADAASILMQQSAQELAVTDPTKTVFGAWMDITVTLVASIGVAAGIGDVAALFEVILQRQRPRAAWVVNAARFLTRMVVWVGLVLPTILVLFAEVSTHKLNADGQSSKVGWLAKETVHGSGPFTIIAAVTVRLEAPYSKLAFAFVVINVVLACLAASCICAAKLYKERACKVLDACNAGIVKVLRACKAVALGCYSCLHNLLH